MSESQSQANPIDVNHCVVCGSDDLLTVLYKKSRTEGEGDTASSVYHAHCQRCHARFCCDVTASSDPSVEGRAGSR